MCKARGLLFSISCKSTVRWGETVARQFSLHGEISESAASDLSTVGSDEAEPLVSLAVADTLRRAVVSSAASTGYVAGDTMTWLAPARA